MASDNTVTVTINEVELHVPKGELIVEAAKRLGVFIPIFCYHPRMKPVGMCRMCFVEVGFKGQDGTMKMMPKPQTACTLPASDGMVVYTDTEAVHRDRKGVLEFLLINHPLDCPICDRGGECPLQNNTLFYGPSTSRYVELKRHLPKAYPLSKYVTLDLERCIQCGRCVRFTEEISGDSQLAFRFRGASMQPSTFELKDFTSKFSGNVIEICPVGALTSAAYRFRARPWDLETKPAICTVCSNGCNVWFDYRVGRMVRINGRANDAVNEEWTCDRGKFGHEFYNSEMRLAKPHVRRENRLVPSEWSDAFAEVIEAFKGGGSEVAAIGGSTCSNEDVYLLSSLFRQQFGSNNLDHRFAKNLPTYEQRMETHVGLNPTPSSISSYEERRAMLVFGCSLADEEPILFLRIRKAWSNFGAKVIVAADRPTDVDAFAVEVLRYKPGTENVLAAGLLKAAVEAGKLTVSEEAAKTLASMKIEDVAKTTGVPAQSIRDAGVVLGAEQASIIATRNLLRLENPFGLMKTLSALGRANGGGFSMYGLDANDQGCESLGILPDMTAGFRPIPQTERGLDTNGILQACADGKIKALWLVNCEPFERHWDRALVQRALETVDFLVYQGIMETESCAYASVILPMAAPAESDGTFTNIEGRVQRMQRIIAPKGEAKDAWRIFQEVALRMAPTVPFFNAREVMEAIALEAPSFSADVYGPVRTMEIPITPGVSPGAETVAGVVPGE